MEWGDFFTEHLPMTEYDKALDSESLNRGEQVMHFTRLFSLFLYFRLLIYQEHVSGLTVS